MEENPLPGKRRCFNRKTVFPCISISIIKIRLSHNHLIFTGIHILGNSLFIETNHDLYIETMTRSKPNICVLNTSPQHHVRLPHLIPIPRWCWASLRAHASISSSSSILPSAGTHQMLLLQQPGCWDAERIRVLQGSILWLIHTLDIAQYVILIYIYTYKFLTHKRKC